MALGAPASAVLRMVSGQGVKLMTVGLVIGIATAFALTRVLSSLVFGVGLGDPATFFGVVLVLGIAALAACYIPARRASRVDPVIALRQD